MNSKFAKFGGILIVLVALAALIGSTMTFAQDETPTEPETPAVEALPDVGPKNSGQRGARGHDLFSKEDYQVALADALAITVEELESAQAEAKASLIEQAVNDGKITQAQADAILSGEGVRAVLQDVWGKDAMQTAVADALGMSVEALEAARADGKRLSDIAAEQGVELTAVEEAVQAAHDAAIAQAVADGLLTQEQADQLQNRGPRGKGGHGGRGNGGGNGRFGG